MDLSDVIKTIKDKLDKEGRLSNGNPQAAVLLPFFVKNSETHLVFIKRTEHLRKHSGQISFPGGKIDKEDDDIFDTALRETQEEIGIPKEQFNVKFKFHDFSTPYYTAVTPIIATFSYPQKYIKSVEEVEEIIEIPLVKLMDPKIHRLEYWEFRGSQHAVHFFDYQSNVKKYEIWGATANVVFELISALLK